MDGPRRYRVLESLGRGGFGTVYRAELLTDGGFRRFVALKLLHEERASVADRARFHDEAQLLALIRHRSIVGVDALVELDGRWAMVMELVEGADLDRLLRRGAPPLRASLQIIEEIASALVAAFETVVDGRRLGLVHRDLKHGNVRVTLRGEVKLLDFGIASGSFEGRLAETATGEVMGTLRFMAPERMEGASGPATDVYSLGVMACDLLTGAALPPTSALRPGEQRALVRARLAEIDPDAPSEVSDLVSAMLSFEPASRPDAREVAARCRALAQAAPGPSLDTWARSAIERLPPTRSAPDATTSEWVGRTLSEASVTARAAPPWSRPSVLAAAGLGVAGVVAAGAAAVVVGVAGIASASWLAMRLARDPPAGLGEGDLVLTELPVWETDIEGLALSADGAVLTYTDGTVGRVDLEAGSFGSLGEGLGGSPSRSGEESFVLTGFPLRAARLAVDGTRTSVPTHDAVELAPAPGDRLVYTSALGLSSGGLSRSVLRELDLTGGTDRILVDQGAAASSPSVNDAGVLAWRVENDGLYTLGPAGEVREGLRGAFVDVGWRSDEALYVLERVGTTSKLSVSRVGPDGAMSPPEEVVSSDGEINEIATSPSTGRVAFVAAQRQRGFVLYPTTGKPVRRDVGARGWDYTLSPDGTRFAMLREPPSGPTTGPSGRRALAVGIEEVQSNVGDHWLALDVDTARNLRWCPDGSCLWVEGAVDGQWRLLEVALGAGEAREILSLPGGSQGAVGSPDGARVAYTTGRGLLSLVDVDTGAAAPGPEVRGLPLDWSPDGRSLLLADLGTVFLWTPPGAPEPVGKAVDAGFLDDRRIVLIHGSDHIELRERARPTAPGTEQTFGSDFSGRGESLRFGGRGGDWVMFRADRVQDTLWVGDPPGAPPPTVAGLATFHGPMWASLKRPGVVLVLPRHPDLATYATTIHERLLRPLGVRVVPDAEWVQGPGSFGAYGSPSSNRAVAAIAEAARWSFDEDGITVDRRRFDGPHLALAACWPNPVDPTGGYSVYAAHDDADLVGINGTPHGGDDWLVVRRTTAGFEVVGRGSFEKAPAGWSLAEGP